MIRHDRSRGGSISVASSTVTPWSTGSFPWSPTPVSPSLLFFSYTYIYIIYILYIGLLPPCLILVFPPSIGLSILSDARLLLIIHLPFSLSLYATFRSACSSLCFLRTLNRARSLFYLLLTLIVCTNSVSLSLCHSHSLLTMIVAILCIYPCLITMHVMYSSLLIDVLCVALCVSLSSLLFRYAGYGSNSSHTERRYRNK